ncbi:MAG: response regulator transcription factor [Alicyclobacillus sp.]|nr:response regulator transcription factor [Alicyclobacillus sp.]
MERILVVEDEEPIADILRFSLEREGYAVEVAFDGNEAVRAARTSQPDLILLDLMLPEKNGFEVCREVRTFSAVPIIILTAREAEVDKVLGLELGADDYVTKPFSMRELLARVRANLRRRTLDTQPGPEGVSHRLHVGELVIDLERYEVTKREAVVPLTHREFELLAFLASRPGQVFTREQLLAEVWGTDYAGDDRTVDVTVRRLREKVEDDPSNPTYIVTKRGVGYFVRR